MQSGRPSDAISQGAVHQHLMRGAIRESIGDAISDANLVLSATHRGTPKFGTQCNSQRHSEALSELQSRAPRHSASYNLELAPSQRESAPVAITIDCARMTELFVVILNGRDDKSTDSAASSSNVAAKRIA